MRSVPHITKFENPPFQWVYNDVQVNDNNVNEILEVDDIRTPTLS
jgi:hypothetical protein